MENSFNGCSTESFINWLVKDNRGLKISVWTTCDMLPVAGARFMMAGADSFIDLRRQGKEGNKLMEKVLRGDYDCPPDVKAAMAKVNYSTDFATAPTGKERIVIHCTIFGDSIATIAKKMGIEVRTVKYHKENIHKKCGGSSLFVLLQYAIYHSVVSVEEFLEALNDSTKQER
jgi:DNA-binding NarL/FixJ family response regulator